MSLFSHQRTILLVALIGGVLIWNYHRKPDHAPSPAAPAPLPPAATAPTPAEPPAPAAAVVPAAPVPPTPGTPALPVPAVIPPTSTQVLPGSSTDVAGAVPGAVEAISEDLSAVDSAIRNFQAVLGENPIGSNAEITAALLGNNLKQIKLEVPVGSHINGDGQMCDRWGTPYFFHQVSATQMEIRSAGPDRQMWTGDDSQM